MRALLVVNPAATTTSPRARDVIARALASDLKLDVAETLYRGHAMELAAQGRRDDYNLVLALGGDGTVNEVVNGLLAEGGGSEVPLLGVLPGGSTNVFARAVGLSSSAIEATSQILDAYRERRYREIGLGLVEDRYFTFSAGFGLDAEVITRVEASRARGVPATPGLFIRSAARQILLESRRQPPRLQLQADGAPSDSVHTVIVANTAPWTYWRHRPLNPCPQASFDTGLDVLALHQVGLATMANYVPRILFAGTRPLSGQHVTTLHDLPSLLVTADRPTEFQVDGDALGLRTELEFRSVPRALRVLA